MKNCLHSSIKWIFCLLATIAFVDLSAQNVRDDFCDKAVVTSCGATVTSTTAGGTNVISNYPQCNHYTFSGPEKVYQFTTTSAGNIRIDLNIHKADLDLDLLLLSENCGVPTCLAQSITSNRTARTEQINYNNAPAGTYYVLVDSEKDVGAFDLTVNCSTSTGGGCDLKYTATPNHISCGGSKGSIDVAISHGVAPFKIEWDNASNTIWKTITTHDKNYKITDLPAGTYLVKITDSKGCQVMKNNIVINNKGNALEVNFSTTDAACGEQFGFINIDVLNSSPPYWITVKGPKSGTVQGNSNNTVIRNMPAGDYEVTVEKGGCTKTGWVKVGKKSGIDFHAEVSDATCDKSGSFWITVHGGDPTYTIEWWHKDGTSSWMQSASKDFPMNGMKAGEYTIKITDRHGCSKSKKVTMGSGGKLDFALEANGATCGGKGRIWVTVKNGTPSYEVEWSGASSGWKNSSSKSFAIDDLVAGQYEVKIKDSKGCTHAKWVTVTNHGGNLDFELEANAASCGTKGAIWVTVKNGSPKYTVEWWGPNLSKWASTSNKSFQLNDLVAGNYTVKITDSKGCSNTKTIKISNANHGLDFALRTLGTQCGNKGSIWIDINNGKANYSVDIVGPNTNKWFESSSPKIQVPELPAGNYRVDITDATGCKGTKHITIHNSGNHLEVALESNAAGCDKTGSIWVTIKNGAPKYEVELSGTNGASFWAETSSSSFRLSELGAATYTVKIKDKNHCTVTKTIKVDGGSSNMHMATEVNHASCSNSNGRIWVTFTGGTPSYHLTWSGPTNGDIFTSSSGYQINNLKSGTYTLKVKDYHGCVHTKTVSVHSTGHTLGLALEANKATCTQNGYIWAEVKHGVGPYQVSWSGASSGSMNVSNKSFQISNLPQGNYTVTVKDKNGCTVVKQVTIHHAGSDVDFYMTANHGACGQKGYATVTVTKGSGPYQISWSGPQSGSAVSSSTSYQISNLTGGRYHVTVKDKNGCTTQKHVDVHSGGAFTISTKQDHAVCGQSGKIWVDITGGKAPFSLELVGPMVGSTVTNDQTYHFTAVPKGSYTLKVKDANGCEVSQAVTISDLGGNLTLSAETNKATCGKGGSAWLTISGGVAPYTVNWSGPTSGVASASGSGYQLLNLPAGTYTVKITDKNGCHVDKSITINDTGNSLSLSLEATNASCGQKGAIVATVKNGTANYSYSWSGPVSGSILTSQTSYRIEHLTAGTYTVKVKDGNGCETTQSVELKTVGGSLQVSAVTTSSVACEHDGSATITVMGGTAPYKIHFTGPTVGSAESNTEGYQINGLQPGDYTFNVTDKNGCAGSAKLTVIDNGTDLDAKLTAKSAVCGGKGTISMDITGGIPNFQISWVGGGVSGAVTTDKRNFTITDLPVGTYTVEIKDGIGCKISKTISVNNTGSPISIQLVPKNDVCGKGGSIEVRITGGQATYQVDWSGPANGTATTNDKTFVILGLPTGNIEVKVKDKNGCEAKEWVAINTGGDVGFNLVPTHTKCNKKGVVTVNITSGSPTYTISWTGPSSGSQAINTNLFQIKDLAAGTYAVTVKDAKDCEDTKSVVVNATGGNLALTLTNTNTSCSNSNGSITATVANGEGDYTFSWTGPMTGSQTVSSNSYTLNNLPAGTYKISVLDKNGCTVEKSIEVKDGGNNLALTATGKNAACGQPSSIQVTVANGSPKFLIEWSGPTNGSFNTNNNSYTITNLADGEYIVRVTDASGCSKAQAVILKSNRNDVNFTYQTQDAACGGKGAIFLTITSGNGPYNIAWSGPVSGSSTSADAGVQITDLPAGTYSVTVSDKDGCVITQTIEVKTTNSVRTINYSYKASAATCNEQGNILITMIIGTAPYTVNWTGPSSGTRTASTTDIRIENLAVGTYEVTVKGADGCDSLTQKVVIEDKKTVLGVNGTVTNGVCGEKGSVTLNWTGDRDPYTISWTGAATGSIATNAMSQKIDGLKNGTYNFTVTGFDGCTGQYQATINNSGTAVKAGFTFSINAKTLTFANSSTAGTYAWDFGDGKTSTETSPTHTYENNGTYNVCLQVTNACGTKQTCQSVTINAVIGDDSPAKILLGDMSGTKGTVLQMPVKIENCSRLATLSGTIKLGNNQVAKINGLSPNAISPIYNDQNHSFSFLASGLGMNITSETVLFYINVQLIGETGQSSLVDFSSLPVSLELTCTENGFSLPITPEVGGGRVSITTSSNANAGVSGNVLTYWGDGIAQTMVTIKSKDHEMSPMTSVTGEYEAKEVPTGYEYTITPSKTSNPVNGLSTFGMFLAQKYILGYRPEEVVSPYQVIAMDANCSGSLTTFDLFVMQQMLVGNISEFPGCDSWVFVNADYEFPEAFDHKNVFPYETAATMMLNEETAVADFIGIKVGDILGRAIPNEKFNELGNHQAMDRSRRTATLAVSQLSAEAGEIVEVTFRPQSVTDIVSYQLALDFDQQALSYTDWSTEAADFANTMVGIQRNHLKLNWYDAAGEGIELAEDAQLFTLKFVANEKIVNILDHLSISKSGFQSELHQKNNQAYNLQLTLDKAPTLSNFKLHQNTPNPFLHSTIITVELPKATTTEVVIHDHFGKVIRTVKVDFEKGSNQLELNRNQLSAGVYYYTVKAGKFTATKRMLVVE
ncbi:MAG: T9SS type A sorting domain-containing protein [Bacteroidota bacterium]